MKSTMKKSVVGACIAALSPIGLLASSPLAHGIPNIPLDIPDVPPACDPAKQNCDVPPASILLPYFEVDLSKGPGVSFDPVIGGLVAHISDNSGIASQCKYQSDSYTRSFSLPAKSTYDLRIVPAIPEFRDRPVSVTCDNGTSTNTSTFF